MDTLTQAQRDAIAKKLADLNAAQPCPRCGNSKFTLLDGLFIDMIQKDASALKLTGGAIVSAVVICDKCGFISQHALGPLGFLKPTGELNL